MKTAWTLLVLAFISQSIHAQESQNNIGLTSEEALPYIKNRIIELSFCQDRTIAYKEPTAFQKNIYPIFGLTAATLTAASPFLPSALDPIIAENKPGLVVAEKIFTVGVGTTLTVVSFKKNRQFKTFYNKVKDIAQKEVEQLQTFIDSHENIHILLNNGENRPQNPMDVFIFERSQDIKDIYPLRYKPEDDDGRLSYLDFISNWVDCASKKRRHAKSD